MADVNPSPSISVGTLMVGIAPGLTRVTDDYLSSSPVGSRTSTPSLMTPTRGGQAGGGPDRPQRRRSRRPGLDHPLLGGQRSSQIVAIRLFCDLDDLVRVDGIGVATVEAIRQEGLACAS